MWHLLWCYISDIWSMLQICFGCKQWKTQYITLHIFLQIHYYAGYWIWIRSFGLECFIWKYENDLLSPPLKITLWLTVQLETVLFFIVTVFHLWLEMYHGVILVSGSWANTNMPLLGSQGAKSLKRTHEIALSRVWMGSTCIISREIIITVRWSRNWSGLR